MKTVLSNLPNNRARIGMLTGPVDMQFVNHKWTGPDIHAHALVSANPHNYRLANPDAHTLPAGTRVFLERGLGIGDVLMTTPLIRALHAQGLKVTYFTDARHVCLLKGNPYIEGVFPKERLPGMLVEGVVHARLDGTVENLEQRGHTDHRVVLFGRQMELELTEADLHLDYYLDNDEVASAMFELRELPRPVVAYVWGTTNQLRNWDDEQHEKTLAALVDGGYSIALINSNPVPFRAPENWPIKNFAAKTSIRQAIALLSCVDAVLTPDTGMFHAAGAVDAPTVGYFGTKPYEEFQTHRFGEGLTYRAQTTHDPKHCSLLPCRRYHGSTPGCMHAQRKPGGMPPCIALDPDAILAAVNRVIAKKRKAE